jgi:hypothetical protein
MKSTTPQKKKYYRRLLAVLQKNNGRTFADLAMEHGLSIGQFKDGYQRTSRWEPKG